MNGDELLDSLLIGCRTARGMNDLAGNTLRVEMLGRVEAAIKRLREGSVARPTPQPDEDELLRDFLAQSIFLKKPLVGPHLRYGLGLLNLTLVLAAANTAGAEHLNGALSDILKVLRMGPVQYQLHQHIDLVANLFHDHLEQSLAGCGI